MSETLGFSDFADRARLRRALMRARPFPASLTCGLRAASNLSRGRPEAFMAKRKCSTGPEAVLAILREGRARISDRLMTDTISKVRKAQPTYQY